MPIQYRSDALRKHLADLCKKAPAVIGATIVTNDGLVIALHPSGWDRNIQDPTGGENVAAMASVVASTAERTMERLAQGELERVLMEGEKGTVGVFPITADSSLAVLIKKEAKLGLTLNAARQTALLLRDVLNAK